MTKSMFLTLSRSVSARIHRGLCLQRDLGGAQLQHVQLCEMVHVEENALPWSESFRAAEEGISQRSQPRQIVSLRSGFDANSSRRSRGGSAEANDGRAAQRAPSTQRPRSSSSPRRRPGASVSLSQSAEAGERRQGQIQMSQA